MTPTEFLEPLMTASAIKASIKDSPHSVFFYPAGLYDGSPLCHFSDLCTTFIYCDVAFNPAELVGGMQTMMAQVGAEFTLPLGIEEIGVSEFGFSTDKHPDCFGRHMSPQYRAGYEEVATIVRQHGGPSGRKFECRIKGRSITVICLCAESALCYAALFTRQNVAPRAVCLKQHIPDQRRLAGIDEWYGPLGRAVADSPQPEFVVTGHAREDDWPWQTEARRFDKGQLVAYRRFPQARS